MKKTIEPAERRDDLLDAAKRGVMALAANGAPNCEAAKELRAAIKAEEARRAQMIALLEAAKAYEAAVIRMYGGSPWLDDERDALKAAIKAEEKAKRAEAA